MKKFILLLLIGLAALVASCSTGIPNPGFALVTVYIDPTSFLGAEQRQPGIRVAGRLIAAADDASGNVTQFSDTSSFAGEISVAGGRAPGLWAITENNGPCAGLTDYASIERAQLYYARCIGGEVSLSFQSIFT